MTSISQKILDYILNNLVPGDTILADCGFDIKDSVGFYCATVTLPAFVEWSKHDT